MYSSSFAVCVGEVKHKRGIKEENRECATDCISALFSVRAFIACYTRVCGAFFCLAHVDRRASEKETGRRRVIVAALTKKAWTQRFRC